MEPVFPPSTCLLPSFLGRALKIGADGRTQVFESMIAPADLRAKIIAVKGDVKMPAASIGNDQTSSFLLTDAFENFVWKVKLILQDIQALRLDIEFNRGKLGSQNLKSERQPMENDGRSRPLRHKLKVWGQGRECLKHRKSVSFRTARSKSVNELIHLTTIDR